MYRFDINEEVMISTFKTFFINEYLLKPMNTSNSWPLSSYSNIFSYFTDTKFIYLKGFYTVQSIYLMVS